MYFLCKAAQTEADKKHKKSFLPFVVCSFFVGKAQSPSKILHFGSFKAYSYPKTLWRKADEAQCFGDPVAIGRIRPIFFRPTSGRWSHGPAAAWPPSRRPSLWRVPSSPPAPCEDLWSSVYQRWRPRRRKRGARGNSLRGSPH